MSLNVFATPASIQGAITPIFPSAQYSGDVDEDGFTFSMQLTLPGVAPVVIRNALDARELMYAVEVLARRAMLCTSASTLYDGLPCLDIARFSLNEPLSDWQQFQRARYESAGNRCLDVLVAYLSGVDEANALQKLKQLGLAPGQIARSCKDDDFAYFWDLVQELRRRPPQAGRLSFERLQERYPVIIPAITAKLQEVFRAEALQGGQEDTYQVLFTRLNAAVLGQESAAKLLAVELASSPGSSDNKVFLFVGPTGVGKTEMAKRAASIKNERFIMLSMNQYQSEHSVTSLFGSPPSYVGSTDKPYFAKAIEQYAVNNGREGSSQILIVKDVVILFDEFEKAHSKIKQSLLTLFDEGYCKIQYTKTIGGKEQNIEIKYRFARSIFIGTSNLYQEQIVGAFQGGKSPEAIGTYFKTLNRDLPCHSSYSQELLGRMTVVPFRPIPRGDCYQRLIQSKMPSLFQQLAQSVGCKSIEVENQQRVLEILENRLYGEGVDIRRVKRYFEEDLKTFIQENKRRWGNLAANVLVLLPYEENRLGVKVVTYFCGACVPLYDPVPVCLGDNIL